MRPTASRQSQVDQHPTHRGTDKLKPTLLLMQDSPNLPRPLTDNHGDVAKPFSVEDNNSGRHSCQGQGKGGAEVTSIDTVVSWPKHETGHAHKGVHADPVRARVSGLIQHDGSGHMAELRESVGSASALSWTQARRGSKQFRFSVVPKSWHESGPDAFIKKH